MQRILRSLLIVVGCVALVGVRSPDTVCADDSAAPSVEAESETPAVEENVFVLSDEQEQMLGELEGLLNTGHVDQIVETFCELYEQGVPISELHFDTVWSKLNGRTGLGPFDRLPTLAPLWERIAPAVKGTEHLGYHSLWSFRTLMEAGERDKAMQYWNDFLERNDPEEERFLWVYAVGFVRSSYEGDRERGLRLANEAYEKALVRADAELEDIRVADPVAMKQMREVLVDHEIVGLGYCLSHTDKSASPEYNPFLSAEPETSIRFEMRKDAGFAGRIGKSLSLADIDNDGYPDVLCATAGLWKNKGGRGEFKRVDKKLGIDVKGDASALADLDNNGRCDVIIAGRGVVRVYMQDDAGVFTLLEGSVPVAAQVPRGIAVFDGNFDGILDLYIASYEGNYHAAMGVGTPDVVLRGVGDGTFEDVAEAWNFTSDELGYCGRGLCTVDYDNDGRTDIHVSNYRLARNQLWRNVGTQAAPRFEQCASAPWFGEGEKRDVGIVGEDLGIQGRMMTYQEDGHNYYGHSIGSAFGDLDNNGYMDHVVANLAHPRFVKIGFSDLSRVYMNTGKAFIDNSFKAGVTFRERQSGPLMADFNNDGKLDMIMSSGQRHFVSQCFEGRGDGNFSDVSWQAGALAQSAMSHAAFDYDQDGDLDWIAADGNRGILLFENVFIKEENVPPKGNFVSLVLRGGEGFNAMAFGVRVEVEAGPDTYIREVFGARGSGCCDEPVVHVGLGQYSEPVRVTLRWGQKSLVLDSIGINQRHVIELNTP